MSATRTARFGRSRSATSTARSGAAPIAAAPATPAWCSATATRARRSPDAGCSGRSTARGWRADRRRRRASSVEPRGEEPDPTAAADEPRRSGVQELCRVHGTVTIGGTARALDCVGTRTRDRRASTPGRSPRRAPCRAGSATTWRSRCWRCGRRARRATSDDLVAATLFDPDGWVPVADPRLSTTYADAGAASADEPGAVDRRGRERVPRRAAGEAAGAGCRGDRRRAAAARRAAAMSQPRPEGAGVYVLASF